MFTNPSLRNRDNTMHHLAFARFTAARLAIVAVLMAAGVAPAAADTVKVGVVGPFSGPFSGYGRNFKAGIEAWMALHGDKVRGHDVKIIYRDLDAIDPARSKALAQELVVKDKVQYLAGFVFTPNAMAVLPLLAPANVPLVVFNAATSSITQKSPLVVRASFTLWQTTVPMAKVAAARGIRKALTAVSDYAPGIDAETAFKTTFEAAGGTVVETIRMPVKTVDFAPIMQRIRDSGAEAVFSFIPSGPSSFAFVKAFNDSGLKGKVQLLLPGDLLQESDLPALGEAALGLHSTYHYAVSHPSRENEIFVAEATRAIGNRDELTFPAVGAYDGMRMIYRMIEATDGRQDAARAVEAVKGLSFESPRGPVTVDPKTRHVRQTIYLREVAKGPDGRFINREIESYPDQPDWGLPAN